jgi:hypothetical protein
MGDGLRNPLKITIHILRILLFSDFELVTSSKNLYSQTHKCHKNGIDINCNIY